MMSELLNCSTIESTEEISNSERVVKLLYTLESTEEISNGKRERCETALYPIVYWRDI